MHPTISEHIDNLGWDQCRAEFEKRELPGVEEIRNVFRRNPSCYGHLELSWVPHSYPVLRNRWDIPVYLDEMHTISPLNDRPFYYCNMLNLIGLGPGLLPLDASDGPSNLPEDHLVQLTDQFLKVYRNLGLSGSTGLISDYAHPTTYATEEFWDSGKNPLDGKAKKPKLKNFGACQQGHGEPREIHGARKVAAGNPLHNGF